MFNSLDTARVALQFLTALIALASAYFGYCKARAESAAGDKGKPARRVSSVWAWGALALGLMVAAVVWLGALPSELELARRQIDEVESISPQFRDPAELEIARVLVGDSELQAQVDMIAFLEDTRETLDVLVFTGYYMVETNRSKILELLRERKVRVRILLMNHEGENAEVFDATALAMGYSVEKIRGDAVTAQERLLQMVGKIADRDAYKGTLEVGWVNGPHLFGMLLRDEGRESQYLQYFPGNYGHFDRRVFSVVGPKGIESASSFARQFEGLWDNRVSK